MYQLKVHYLEVSYCMDKNIQVFGNNIQQIYVLFFSVVHCTYNFDFVVLLQPQLHNASSLLRNTLLGLPALHYSLPKFFALSLSTSFCLWGPPELFSSESGSAN